MIEQIENSFSEKDKANIISGMVSAPMCIAFLGISNDIVSNAQNLNQIMQAMAAHQLNAEVLLLLKIICDLADIDFPQELDIAAAFPSDASELVRQMILDFDDILAEETA